MPRHKISRTPIFRMFALNWDKKKIKKETGLSERAYFIVKNEWEALPEEQKKHIIAEATREEKAKARIEDYDIVQKWIAMQQSERIKSWKDRLSMLRQIWEILDRKNPENWTYDDIKLKAIPQLRKTNKSIFGHLVALRSLRSDFKVGQKAIKTKGEKAKINYEWRIAFKEIVRRNLLQEYFKASTIASEEPLRDEALVRNHIEWGCREGYKGYERWRRNEAPETEIGGILGVRWEDIDWETATIDIYETKTAGGIKWLGCPMKLFSETAFNMIKEYWEKQGKPQSGRIFQIGIQELAQIHIRIRKYFDEKGFHWAKVIQGHFDRKLHASLLKAAHISLEVVAGEAPHGIVGVGWEDLTTLVKFYSAFADEEIEQSLKKARTLQL